MDVTSTAMSGLTGQNWKEQMLTGNASKKEQADQIAAEFEGVLLRKYLDEAFKPLDPESDSFFGAGSSPMYEHLIKDSLATSMTKSGSLGFSSVVQAQLFPQDLNAPEGTSSNE